MAESEHEWISKRAYALWEEQGYPTGRDNEHWETAKQEYLLFAPLGVTKGLPKGKKPKANGEASEKPAPKKTAAAKTAKASPAKIPAVKPASEKTAEKAAKPTKAKAIAAEAKPAAKTRSKKLTAE